MKTEFTLTFTCIIVVLLNAVEIQWRGIINIKGEERLLLFLS